MTSTGWTYRPSSSADAVEFGTVTGRDVALPAHFHDEDQVTFVLSGRRRFGLGGRTRTIEAGGGILIPARSVHRSLAEPAGVACLNLYVPAGLYAGFDMMRVAADVWRTTGNLDHVALATIVEAHRLGRTMTAAPDDVLGDAVAERARRAGVTREGFSRAFARRHGMPPHAFALVARLNHARRLLRDGEPIAAVACDAGFADQSHFGRRFRHAFGVTPGRYREGQART